MGFHGLRAVWIVVAAHAPRPLMESLGGALPRTARVVSTHARVQTDQSRHGGAVPRPRRLDGDPPGRCQMRRRIHRPVYQRPVKGAIASFTSVGTVERHRTGAVALGMPEVSRAQIVCRARPVRLRESRQWRGAGVCFYSAENVRRPAARVESNRTAAGAIAVADLVPL